MPPFFSSRRRLAIGLLLGTLGAWMTSAASAQSFPERPLRLLVGFNPGGGVDAMARLLAQRLSAQFGQQVVVENRSGASGMIAAETVAKSPADGYTILLGETGMYIASVLQPRAGFDPLKSLEPVAGVAVVPMILVANNDVPAKTPRELLPLLKSNPGKFSYASPGVGTIQQLGFEMIKARTGSFVVHVPYRGASQFIPDVIGGQIPFAVVSLAAGLPSVRAGKLKAIALMDDSKMPGTEDIPRMSEAIPGFAAAARLMLYVPAGTPPGVVAQLESAVRTAAASAEFAEGAVQQSSIAAFIASSQIKGLAEKEAANWQGIIKAQKIGVE